MKRHKHTWERTGSCHYTMPGQYEEKCQCGKIRWVEGEGIPRLTLTQEEMRKRRPNLYKNL